MATKLSPYDLAEEVTVLELPENEYNHKTQTRFDVVNPILAATTTYNGTQTFDSKGQPKDNDNDKD